MAFTFEIKKSLLPGKVSCTWNQNENKDLQCKLLTREVNYMKRIVSTNGYRKEKSNTQVVLALKDTKPRTVVDVRIRQGLKKYN